MAKGGSKEKAKQSDEGPENEYEKQRLMTIEANKSKMKSLGLKKIASSLTSLVESTKEKRRKTKQKTNIEDDDEYIPDDDLLENESEKEVELMKKRKMNEITTRNKKSTFIPPNSLSKFLRMNKQKQKAMVGNEALESLSTAIELVQKAISSQQMDEDVDLLGDIDDQLPYATQVGENHENIVVDKDSGVNIRNYDDSDGPIGKEDGLEDEFLGDIDEESRRSKFSTNIEGEITIRGTLKKRRGPVYCRKLVALPPGEKIHVDYDEDGIAIGPNASLYAHFLGEQVRNRSVCPVQVKGWKEFTAETLDHLWSCVLEKCSFDDPELRKEFFMKHARKLHRDSRHKLKSQYFDDPTLLIKEQRFKNKPDNMIKEDWIYLVEHWSDEKFQEKSRKSSENRGHQKMPHYSGSKGFARLRQEIMHKNEGKCSRVDVMIESRKRNSKKCVNEVTLATNKDVIDKLQKMTEEREQGLNEKTDQEIFQDVLGKDNHGYLRGYGPGKSITDYHRVKPSKLNLAQEVVEVRKSAEEAVAEAKKEADNAKVEAESAKKEAQAVRNEVKQIAAKNKVWEKLLKKLLDLGHPDSPSESDSASSSSK